MICPRPSEDLSNFRGYPRCRAASYGRTAKSEHCPGWGLSRRRLLRRFARFWGDVLGLVRWPILAGIVTLALAIVYRYAPNRAEPKWQWISWGSVAAAALWVLGSIAFTIHVSKVGSYDKTYGSLGAVIILLLWFYLTAYVILAGAELNAEIERQITRAAVCSPDPTRLWRLCWDPRRILTWLIFGDGASALRHGARESRTARGFRSIPPVHQLAERLATA
jgi:hypothetical protein